MEVLLAGNHRNFSKNARRILDSLSEKLNIEVATDWNEFFLSLEKKEYDAVITDYQAQEEKKLTLLRKLEKKGYCVPFIVRGTSGTKVSNDLRNGNSDPLPKKSNDPKAEFREIISSCQETDILNFSKYTTKRLLDSNIMPPGVLFPIFFRDPRYG